MTYHKLPLIADQPEDVKVVVPGLDGVVSADVELLEGGLEDEEGALGPAPGDLEDDVALAVPQRLAGVDKVLPAEDRAVVVGELELLKEVVELGVAQLVRAPALRALFVVALELEEQKTDNE